MKLLKNIFTVIFLSCICNFKLLSQITGGNHVWQSLDVVHSAQAAAMGQYMIAHPKSDMISILQNPSMLNASHIGEGAVAYSNYFSSTHSGALITAFDWKKKYIVSPHLRWVNYGIQDVTDEQGSVLGKMYSNDANLGMTIMYPYNKLTYGLQLNAGLSKLYQYTSVQVSATASMAYIDTTRGLMLTLLAKNMGWVVKNYTQEKNTLPFDMQFGIAKQLKYLPLMLSFTYHHIPQFDIRYNNPLLASQSIFQDSTYKEPSYFFDKLQRHLMLGAELKLHKLVLLRLGYNMQMRKEMQFANKKGLLGFTYGLSVRTKNWNFSYAYIPHGFAMSQHNLNISKKIHSFKH